MNNKSICFLVGTLGQGGAERQLYLYLKTLKENGFNLLVLSTTKGDFWEEKIILLGIPVIWIGKSRSPLSRLAKIISICQKNPVDLIYSQHFHMNLYGVLAARYLGVKNVGSLRGNVFSEVKSVPILGRLCLTMPNWLIVNSESGRRNAVKLGREPLTLFYLPNCVDEEFYTPVESRKSETLSIIFVGTIWPIKRVDRVINLAKKCLDQSLNVEINIYGNGILLSQLKQLASDLGVLDRNLMFCGTVDDPIDVYQNSDVLILTSDHEGMPNVVLEAMSCGLPIISTRVGDIPDIIESGENGFLVDPGDEDGLFTAVHRLYTEPSLRERIGRNNREKIVRQRSIKYLDNNLINILSIINAS